MSMRSIRTELSFFKYRRSHPKGCGYCLAYEQRTEQLVEIKGSMLILKARFPYSRWDGWKVHEHLLVVPARHITSLGSLSPEESQDLIDCVAQYEVKGFSFYIRAASNKSRTMPHVHGHLIKGK